MTEEITNLVDEQLAPQTESSSVEPELSSAPDTSELVEVRSKPSDAIFRESVSKSLSKIQDMILILQNSFLDECNVYIRKIEDTTNVIIQELRRKEEEIKAKIGEIQEERIRLWRFQMDICQNARHWLENEDSVECFEELRGACSPRYLTHVRSVETGDFALIVNQYPVIKSIRRLGKFLRKSHNIPVDTLMTRGQVQPTLVFGTRGEELSEFSQPWGIAVDISGHFIVSDRGTHRIQVFSSTGRFLFFFGKKGSAAGEFREPTGVAVTKNFRILVADKNNHRIQVFSRSGTFLFSFGKLGKEVEEFTYPWDVSVNSKNQIAVSDSGNNRIQLFDSEGAILLGVAFAEEQMGLARGLAFDIEDNLMVTDTKHHRVLALDDKLKWISSFGEKGRQPVRFVRPQGVSCANDSFAVADSQNHRIQIFDVDGCLMKIIGSYGPELGELDRPQGLTFLPDGRLAVVDSGNNRVQIF